MPSVIKRGKATVEGVAGTMDVIIYPTMQSIKATQNFQEEIIKDEHGYDAAWLARNEHTIIDINLRLTGDSAANAKAGGAFLAPWATITFSGFDLAFLNTTWQNQTGAAIDLGNDKVGGFDLKLRRYADATQNTASVTTPG